MPWLTPTNTPEDDDCRPLSIPASSDWLALVSGALNELVLKWNWQVGQDGISVEDTIARMQTMIDAYYDGCTPCDCTLPGGDQVMRLNPNTGHVEQLSEDGTEWVTPYSPYVYPTIPAREENALCLAATNCANVLEAVYESLSDSWASHLSEAEAETAILLIILGFLGPETVGIATAILAIATAAFALLYETLAYIGADLWTSDFTKNLVCILQACGTDDEGVVTFDWECFNEKLEAQINIFNLNETQLRLNTQLQFILYCIGGSDALNQAGASTAITDADCSYCDAWCWTLNFSVGDGGFSPYIDGCYGQMEEYASNVWQAIPSLYCEPLDRYATTLGITKTLPTATYTFVQMRGYYLAGIGGGGSESIEMSVGGEPGAVHLYDDGTWDAQWSGSITGTPILSLALFPGSVDGVPCGGIANSRDVIYKGEGENPFGDDNC